MSLFAFALNDFFADLKIMPLRLAMKGQVGRIDGILLAQVGYQGRKNIALLCKTMQSKQHLVSTGPVP